MTLFTLQTCLEALTGFKKYVTGFLLGAVMTLSLSPIGLFPVLLLCVPGFIALSHSSKTRGQSFLTGWAFGSGYFIFGLYWVSAALFVDIKQWGWVLPLSAIAGPMIVALYYGLIPLLARFWRNNMTAYTCAFVAAWSALEYLRGHLFTGFPWNLPGYSWTHNLPVLQTASWAGIYGLTLLTLLWAALPLFYSFSKKVFNAVLISFILLSTWGAVRLYQYPPLQNGHHTVRIVQANIPQTMKWNSDEEWRNFEKHINLTKSPVDSKAAPSFIIWPETSVTMDLKLFPEMGHYISLNMPKDSTGIFGTLRITYDENGQPQFFNSVSVLDSKAKVLDVYDKHHLVPFGESIPFRDKLNVTPLGLAVANIGDFTPGPGVQTLAVSGLPSFSPLICYEVIFPGAVALDNPRPEWLVNVTNDGWYGRTSGPHQHFETARIRAIEEGLPLARAANTGISGMIDPLGRIIGKMSLEKTGTVETILPQPLPPTPYSRYGNIAFFFMLLLLFMASEKKRRT